MKIKIHLIIGLLACASVLPMTANASWTKNKVSPTAKVMGTPPGLSDLAIKKGIISKGQLIKHLYRSSVSGSTQATVNYYLVMDDKTILKLSNAEKKALNLVDDTMLNKKRLPKTK